MLQLEKVMTPALSTPVQVGEIDAPGDPVPGVMANVAIEKS